MELKYWRAYWKTGGKWEFYATIGAYDKHDAKVRALYLAELNGYDPKKIKIIPEK